MKTIYLKKLALLIVFSALGVAISPLTWFEFLGTKAYPAQHMINAILGVLLGPLWAAAAAIIIGVIRNMLGMGTVYAFPGGIPGGIIVGLAYWTLKKFRISEKMRFTAALTEPIGTLLIGVPLSLFLVAPWMGPQGYSARLLDLTAKQGPLLAFGILAAGWALSCIPGSILGFIVLLGLKRIGISRETLFGEK
ncbi:MAG: energy coupling factor transporter S component ThiW [Nitrososphaerota archaeon]|nr:energy coupling factor transporter S component ThiW [Candidatus Bathyarchaeota archaeon]MDW8024062.1 energy coupling factor transporter S component ThiW [Nitrososphaerota archaeon]